MYVWTYVCMYVYIHVCFHGALLACALPVTMCACPPAVRHHTYLLSRRHISCMYAGRYVCVLHHHLCLFVRYFTVARARMLARRTSSRLLIIARIYFMHVRVLDARYVRCRRVSHARAMSARYSYSHARPPFMNERSPVARCSIWLHLCLYDVKYLHAS